MRKRKRSAGADPGPQRRPRDGPAAAAKRVEVDAVRHHLGLDAVVVGEDLRATCSDTTRTRSGSRMACALAVDQRLGGEVVDVVHGAHHRDRQAGVADPAGGPGRDAVLGVEDRRQSPAELGEAGGQGVDGVEDRARRGCRRRRRAAKVRHGTPHLAGEAGAGWPEGDDLDVDAESPSASATASVCTTPPRGLVV